MNGLRQVLLIGTLLLTPAFAVEADPPDPDKSVEALRHLLAAANETVPAKSGCEGLYGQKGPAKVKDLLAMQLGYLYRGDNTVAGLCKADQCEVQIKHSAGESVASAQIRFRLGKGKLETRSLQCMITP
ncbi:hypothetical protein [Chitinimonas lacunae]|uniref:Uncharacterized protein n=1 Tax=Chitinimonas lacunae TaxID=1963018 RepID=A0ABV8MVG9_9NEIS